MTLADQQPQADPMAEDMLRSQPLMPDLHFRRMFEKAAIASGRSKAWLWADYLWRYGRGKRMMLQEYFAHHLYDHDRWSEAEREAHIGLWRNSRFTLALNDTPAYRTAVADKRLHGAMMRGIGIRTPKIQALAWQRHGVFEAPLLRNKRDIVVFLKKKAQWPLFGKPMGGGGSRGTASLERFDYDADEIVFIGGERRKPWAFAREVMAKFGPTGYMFQTRVRPHATLRKIAGETIGSVRAVTLIRNERARVLYALWKAPGVGNISDALWRPGNMLVHLDPDTGTMLRCQQGAGFDAKVLEAHPDTGQPIIGPAIPHWDKLRQTVIRGAELIPKLRICGWDVAVDDDGPLVLEANSNSNHTMHQTAAERGFWTPEMRAIEEEARSTSKARAAAARRRQREPYIGMARDYFAQARRQAFKRADPPSG